MKLSLITINYNNLNGLEKTLKSVFSQKFLDYEYIIVDGGSNDGSRELIEKYKSRFAYSVSEKDAGIFNAMNKGILKSTGEYLLFLNSGDYLVSEDVLGEVFLTDNDADIICGKCRISDKGKIVGYFSPPVIHTFQTYYKTTIAHQATFIKRELFLNYGLYNEKLSIKADWEFWIRTIIKNNSIVKNVNVIVSDYNLEGISSSEDNELVSVTEMQEVMSFLPDRVLADYENWRIFSKDLILYEWLSNKPILKKWLYRLKKIIG